MTWDRDRPVVGQGWVTQQQGTIDIQTLDTSIWFGLVVPAGTPREIVDKLARAAREALQSEDVLTGLHPQGFDALSGGPVLALGIDVSPTRAALFLKHLNQAAYRKRCIADLRDLGGRQ